MRNNQLKKMQRNHTWRCSSNLPSDWSVFLVPLSPFRELFLSLFCFSPLFLKSQNLHFPLFHSFLSRLFHLIFLIKILLLEGFSLSRRKSPLFPMQKPFGNPLFPSFPSSLVSILSFLTFKFLFFYIVFKMW